MPSGALDKISLPDRSVWLAGSSKLLPFERDDGLISVKIMASADLERSPFHLTGKDTFGSLETRGYPYFAKRKANWMTFPIKSSLDGAKSRWRSLDQRCLALGSLSQKYVSRGCFSPGGKAEMVVDSHDNLWAAQADNGPSRILHVSERGSPPVIERAAKSDLTSPQTHALFEDRESNIWIGTERGLISLGGFPIGRKVGISDK